MPGSSNAKPTMRRARARGNFSPKRANADSSSQMKNIPLHLLFSLVLNHASPKSIRRVSQVNKSLKSIAEPRVGGEIVYSKKTPTWFMGMEFYKLDNNGYLKPLQPHGKAFQYYQKNLLRTPITLNEKNAAIKNLRLVHEPAKNRPGYNGYKAYRVKPKSPWF